MAESSASTRSRTIAKHLLNIGAVYLRPDHPFTWASGLKSPIYCDNRLTMAYPNVRRAITDGFLDLVVERGLSPQVVAGTATAGIPHAAWLADRLELPMAYVRSAAKAHGQGKRVEGRIEAGQNVVVVEDLVSTGISSVAVVEAVQEVGATVEGVLAIFTYGLPASNEAFQRAGVPLYTLTDYTSLIEVAVAEQMLDRASLDTLLEWQQDPVAWSRRRDEIAG